MKKKPPSSGSSLPGEPRKEPRRKLLSKEDEALWDHLASSLKPLPRKRVQVHSAVPADAAGEPRPHRPGKSATHHAIAIANAEGRNPDLPKVEGPVVNLAKVPQLAQFDRKAARRLRQGHFEIEARIDLHGMRQVEAHNALRRFLFQAHARGQRWVLIITGKGRPTRHGHEAEQRGESFLDFGSERGVLKRNVPMWLAEPELRTIIVSYTTAAIQHGGEGALYIQLRNPDRLLNR